MPYGLYLSAAGAHAQSKRIEVLANNLANVDTPGFKREIAVLQARSAESIEQNLAVSGNRSLSDLSGGLTVRETVVDYRPGALKLTNIPTDIAIDGRDGFFVVDREGEQLLTRAGNFTLAPDGRLVTPQGFSVLSQDGNPILLNPTAPFRVHTSGRIEQGDAAYSLALVKPVSRGDLVKQGENLFSPLATTIPLPEKDRRVLGGYLEHSGVNPVEAMTEMIEASRAFEANVNLIRTQDQAMGSLISRLLRA